MAGNQNATQNIVAPNNDLEILTKNFPHCFDKNGNFDFEKFKKELATNEINFSKESYGMDWLGKSYARLLATDPAKTLIKEDKDWNTREENKHSENLLIKGDNLEVLKHLSNAYHEKVKMIYIDPPYNTGSDGFVYQDDRKFTVQEFSELAGVDEEQAKKILSFVNSKSNSHSAWLTFMYPRLYIAKQLFKDDGVIFVSIDDNEVAQLRILMDEIFGEENFVGQLIVDGTPKNDPHIVSTSHEYALVYVKNLEKAKNANYGNSNPIYEEILKIFENSGTDYKKTESELKELYKSKNIQKDNIANYKLVDKWGVYRTGPIDDPQSSGPKDERINPKTGKPCKIPSGGWRCTVETWNEWLKDNLIEFPDNDEAIPNKKTYIHKDKTDVLRSYFKIQTRKDTTNLKELFGTDFTPFANPKPIKLLKEFIKNTNDKEALYLDFFAGSGSFGEAIMQCNKDDSGRRKFILVQLPEIIEIKGTGKAKKIAKTAYDFVKNELKVAEPTIFEITKERLIRAGKKIMNDELSMMNEKKQQKADLFSNNSPFTIHH